MCLIVCFITPLITLHPCNYRSMSTNKERVSVPRNPVLPAQTTPEQRFWRGYTNTRVVEEANAVSHISFNPQSPHDFAITSSIRINVFSSKTREVVQTYSRFKDTVYCGEYNPEGRLLMAGDASGLVQMFQTADKGLIRTFKPSTHPTHVVKFHPTLRTQLLTASDDRVARLYDFSDTQNPIISFDDHEDYVRAANFIPGSNLVVTGCYDGFVRIFDARIGSDPVAKFNQYAPVEDVLPLTSTSMATAGGPAVKIWDMTAGKQVHEMGNFQKTVTCLSPAGEDRGIMAGSLDGHVKVFDPINWEVKFGWKFGRGVLSCGVSPNSKHFVAGLVSGTLAIKTRKTEARVKQGVKKEKSNAFKKMMRGAEYQGEEEHRVLSDKPKQSKKLRLYEKHLNAFRWSEALDTAFVPGTARELTVAVLEELKKRGKVRASLYGRDEATLEPLLTWCIKAIEDVRAVNIVSDWVAVVTELDGATIEKSSVLEEIMLSLRKKLSQEVEKAREAQKIEGMLQLLTAH